MGASTILPGGATAQHSKHISPHFGHREAPGTITIFLFSPLFSSFPPSPRAWLVFIYKALLGRGNTR